MREFWILALLFVFLVADLIVPSCVMGVGAFGPTNVIDATVISTHVDAGSNFMVNTDKGTFEVQNSLFLGITNADEIFGGIEKGKRYTFTTKGNKVVGYFFQEYPYVVKVAPR